MGGNALSDVGLVRLTAEAYHRFAGRTLARVREVLGADARVAAIPAYRAKPDFGDLDLLVSAPDEGWGIDKPVQELLSRTFSPTRFEPNGPVLSFDTETGQGRFQVDLIRIGWADFDFALNYYSFNDTGNLLGRVTRKMGFKLGFTGLYKVLRTPGNEAHWVKDVRVSRDWSAVLSFMGYDPDAWRAGFETREDIFRFVVSGRYFDPGSFPLESRSHANRVRDRKRPTYMAFLRWLDGRSFAPGPDADRWNRPAREVFERFPDFRARWDRAILTIEKDRLFRARFNGQRVRELTGLEGPALGGHLCALAGQFDTPEDLRQFVLESSEDNLALFLRTGCAPG